MTTVVLTAVPPGLRGHLTRWLLEISPGVFVGNISPRVRELMWQRIIEFVAEGRAIMVYTARNEQRLAFEVHGHDWTPVDYDGLTLMRRMTAPDYVATPALTAMTTRSTHQAEHQSETVWRRRVARRKFKPK
ncbi:type I-E CRISPR-associated endoribonuclease Cas2e [Nocardia sp. CS682]|uniref:type I-E CRISPR-associated endoribonuclease Cas2e n=1 Tax=Nocardia sp. CS682 TaxID=1047172 RepID=UPI00107536DE|nr:type I-E CRISPR-associated endoribonuclease Cas2e [Nocardia sp. CS682]QBS41302.1 type I-E CRISPR-associated endoribonuclease Cas2 [Nocardia sp. CS682]